MSRRKRSLRNIYILPSLLTSANFFCGVFAITQSLSGEFSHAAIAIMCGLFFDALDGPVARWNRATSRFGTEYDSLADLVSFGVAPMIMVYQLLATTAGIAGRVGLGIAFFYSVCAALRLARYNVQAASGCSDSFSGLPSTGAAAFLASYVLFAEYYQYTGAMARVLPFLMVIVAYLMISNLPYPRVTRALARKKRPFISLVTALLVLVGMILYVHEALIICFSAFTFYGPAKWLHIRVSRRSSVDVVVQNQAHQQ